MSKVLLTGDRPSGVMHLGHYVGSLKSRVELQHEYESYIMVADVQALTDNFENPQGVRASVYEIVRDYLAVGIDPEKATIFIQSQIPELTELTCYYLNLVTVARLERNPTVKNEIKQKGLANSLPVGFFCYPISQAADITAFGNRTGKILVPVGDDQLPMLELTNEIVRRFNTIYQEECLDECEAHLSAVTRLSGIDGSQKASKSLGNAIFLKDDPQEIRSKVFSMYTDPHHVRVSDPGKVEGNVVFTYLDAFHPDLQRVQELKEHYQRGGLGDTVLKEELNRVLQEFLQPIRTRRAQVTDAQVHEVLEKGTKAARQRVQETLTRVRKAMKLDYFRCDS